MLVLGIETSCDETSAAVVQDGRRILSNVISSQVATHAKYSGVVPELASREHLKNINAVVSAALGEAGLSAGDIGCAAGAIAFTRGSGLAGSLLVGQVASQTLAYLHGAALVGVNHIEGHMFSALLDHPSLKPPFLSLVVSGGHTELIIAEDFGKYRYLGGTRDDAAGEAFDKVAKLLGLPYPGGPVIDRLSAKGDPAATAFPRPFMRGTWDFSFSGLKTAVLNSVKRHGVPKKGSAALFDACASFQAAVVDTLVEKTFDAARAFRMRRIVLGGGVSANTSLRKAFAARGGEQGIEVFLPSKILCTDNAAMIACAGYFKYRRAGKGAGFPFDKANSIEPGLELRNWKD